MSLLTPETKELRFLARFEDVWESLRRYQVRQGLCWTFLASVLGLGVLVVADYWWELPWSARAAGLAVAAFLTVAILWARVLLPIRWWTRPRTAVEIEHRFPQLGQRIRTVVQFAGLSEELIESEGMTPTLVDALAEDTEIRSKPLPLDTIVPWRFFWAAAALAALPAMVLILAALSDVEWRIALNRALLGNRPYTIIRVKPGDQTIEQGASVPVAVELSGRLKRDVVLYTRPADQPGSEWKAAPLEPPDRGPSSRREATLEKVKEPLAYRVVAGPASSATYRIGVRYPLAIRAFDVALQPPTYTGVAPSTVKGGDLQVIEGTAAAFRITFDTPPAEVSLVLIDPAARTKEKEKAKGKEAAPPRVIPLKVEGKTVTTALTLTSNLAYRIEARASDGRTLPKNRYRIDVREDRAPRVAFESPDEALEVHPIAEILHRIRVADDFGLTKAGVVFQFNNGDEQTLFLKDFTTATDGKRQTTAALEEMLLLEKLDATPTDSLTYYAFAEDNYPSGAKRSETDLRYIDIRPFKREYKLLEPGEGMGEGESTSLNELIARQRFNLNRGVRLAKHKPTDRTPAEDPLKIATFEETLAGLTREYTEGLEGIAGIRIEPLHEAEESMLAAVAAVDRGHNAEAPLHMSDALRHLIEARRTLVILIADGQLSAQALRAFDRTQAQKIRKPKKEQEEAEAIAQELEELAGDEDFVYATLAGLAADGERNPAQAEKGEEAGKAKMDAEKGEKDAEKDAPEKPSKGDQGTKGQEGEKGPEGQKGPEGPGKGRGTGEPKTSDPGAGKESKDADDEGAAERKKDRRRDAAERQEEIADKARDLEERLKKLAEVSNLAKARMAKATEATEKASGSLARGNTKEATETAKSGAAMLHELARQVKGEVAREVADELAMARDLTAELADREGELGRMPEGNSPSNSPGEKGSDGKGGKDGAGRDGLTDAERVARIDEAAKTLEEWLKGASQRADGETGERVREVIAENAAIQVVERVGQVGEMYLGGQRPEARREATELSKKLEALAQQLDTLHRGIVAPELAELAELDRRLAELTEDLKSLTTEAEVAEWHRLASILIRDLEKAGLHEAAERLRTMIDRANWQAGALQWAGGPYHFWAAPVDYTEVLRTVAVKLQQKMQDLILKDLVSARDEATPPEFKELVERYYEVLSKDNGGK